MKKKFNLSGKSLVFGAITCVVIFSAVFIYSTRAQSLISSLGLNLVVQGTSEFGDMAVMGINNPTNALIVQSGKVGIGTTNPGSTLSVSGTGSFTGQVTVPTTPTSSNSATSKSYVDSKGLYYNITNKTIDTVYQAESDGFIVVRYNVSCSGGDFGYFNLFVGASSNPTEVWGHGGGHVVDKSFINSGTITVPIPSGRYYKLTNDHSASCNSISYAYFWIPLN